MEELAEASDVGFVQAECSADGEVPELANMALTVAELRDRHSGGLLPSNRIDALTRRRRATIRGPLTH